jgi:hypothetical protein
MSKAPAGATSTSRSPWQISDIESLEIPVLFANATGQHNGTDDLSRFVHIDDDRDGSEPYLVDAGNRTIWFRYPDVVWQACGMKGVILVNQEWHSPLSDWRQWTAYFQPPFGRTDFNLGSMPAFGRVSDHMASIKLETASRNGDAVTVVDVQQGRHWALIENRSETGRLGPSTYERVDLRFTNDVEFKHAGTWRIRLDPEIVPNFEDPANMEKHMLSSEYRPSPYCHQDE